MADDMRSPFERYTAAFDAGDTDSMEQILYAVEAGDIELRRQLFFLHLYEDRRGVLTSLPGSAGAQVQQAVEAFGWQYVEEGGHVYALQGKVPIYLGSKADLLLLHPDRLREWLASRDQPTALSQPTPYYVGMSYRGDDERWLQMLPLFLRPPQEWPADREQHGEVRRIFLSFPAAQIKSALYLVETALELLMYWFCLIDGYAFGPVLEQVQAETLVEGIPVV
jgi:hypothetical protein